MKAHEITPMITMKEYQTRRLKLIDNIRQFYCTKSEGKNFMVCIGPTSYTGIRATYKYGIPKIFNFLYVACNFVGCNSICIEEIYVR